MTLGHTGNDHRHVMRITVLGEKYAMIPAAVDRMVIDLGHARPASLRNSTSRSTVGRLWR